MAATTATEIREVMASLMAAITPASLAADRFRRHREEMEFTQWVDANPMASLRRFTISHDGNRRGPIISGADIEHRFASFEIFVAYPNRHARYGGQNRIDQEDLMLQDSEKIEDAIGVRGFANFTDSSIIGSEWTVSRSESDTARYIRITTMHSYYRSLSYVAI